ncbi:hypothetical protein JXA32_16270 [Candidatus Sumerlaeota bacterium]|nr:hypothetical protein [Candidatus Sumerlaeota bacterium]
MCCLSPARQLGLAIQDAHHALGLVEKLDVSNISIEDIAHGLTSSRKLFTINAVQSIRRFYYRDDSTMSSEIHNIVQDLKGVRELEDSPLSTELMRIERGLKNIPEHIPLRWDLKQSRKDLHCLSKVLKWEVQFPELSLSIMRSTPPQSLTAYYVLRRLCMKILIKKNRKQPFDFDFDIHHPLFEELSGQSRMKLHSMYIVLGAISYLSFIGGMILFFYMFHHGVDHLALHIFLIALLIYGPYLVIYFPSRPFIRRIESRVKRRASFKAFEIWRDAAPYEHRDEGDFALALVRFAEARFAGMRRSDYLKERLKNANVKLFLDCLDDQQRQQVSERLRIWAQEQEAVD